MKREQAETRERLEDLPAAVRASEARPLEVRYEDEIEPLRPPKVPRFLALRVAGATVAALLLYQLLLRAGAPYGDISRSQMASTAVEFVAFTSLARWLRLGPLAYLGCVLTAWGHAMLGWSDGVENYRRYLQLSDFGSNVSRIGTWFYVAPLIWRIWRERHWRPRVAPRDDARD